MAHWLMVLFAFAATVAQAQEAKKAAEGAQRAVLREGQQPPSLPASRLALQPSAVPLSKKAGAPDGGAGAGSVAGEGTSDELAPCPAVWALLDDGTVGVRVYSPPPPKQREDWTERPTYVSTAMRCGSRYIFQVKSRSTEPWAIEHARLEGPNGETLQVRSLSFKKGRDCDINIIVAEAPPGVAVASLKLDLTGPAGRVAKLEAGNLP